MELTLILGALLLGAAGIPHCAAMCGPACTMVVRASGRPAGSVAGPQVLWGFLGGRLAGYAVAGALAAAGVGLLAALGSTSAVFKPVWTLLHLSALGLGLWLLVTGRQPGWMSRVWVRQAPGAAAGGAAKAASEGACTGTGSSVSWQPVSGPGLDRPRHVSRASIISAAGAGAAWVAWPCGLLQSALVSASLANTPAGGALVMAAFALSSAVGLVWGPWALSRVSPEMAGRVTEWAVRGAGALLAAGSAWAMGHGAWHQLVAYCFG